MSKKTDLFDLIQALTKAEKRYLKVFAQRHLIHGKNNCLLLFDAIDKQPKYDANALQEEFAGTAVGKNFAATKYELHKLIFKALHAFHAQASPQVQVQEQLHIVEVLFEKGLYFQCQKPLQKARKIAEKIELHIELVSVRQWETRLLPYLSNYGIHVPSEAIRLERELDQIGVLENETQLRLVNSRIHTISIGREVHNPEEKAKVKELVAHPLLKDLSLAQSYKAKLHYYDAHISYHLNFGDLAYATSLCLEQVKHMESDEALKQTHLNEYITLLAKTVMFHIEIGQLDDLFEPIRKMQQTVEHTGKRLSPQLILRAKTRAWYMELIYYCRTGKFEEGALRIPELANLMNEFGEAISPGFHITLSFHAAYILLGVGDFSEALKWNRKGIALSRLGVLPVYMTNSHLLNLILHLELGNWEFLPYAVRSTFRFLLKLNALEAYESAILRFIRRELPKVVSNAGLDLALEGLHQNLLKITKERSQRKKLDTLDLIAWLDSKVSHRPFAVVAREHAAQRLANPIPRH